MGSKGSLHFRANDTNDIENVVLELCTEYGRADSYLNKDKTHNGRGKPFVIVGDCFISVYDGSFAVCGDLNREAKLLADKTNAPVMGVTNANGDLAGIIVVKDGSLVVDALLAEDEWVQEPDVDMLMESMYLPFEAAQINELFECDNADEFISSFHKLIQIPYFLYRDETLSKYCTLTSDFQNISVYKQIAPYIWDDAFEYPV